jgi:hypothetical protein
MVFRHIAGETILVPVHHRAGEEDSIYVLNDAGASAWELTDGKRTVADIIELMLEQFDVDRETLEKDLEAWIGEMVEAGALEEA